MIRTQIQLTEEQADGLKKIASEKRLSIAKLIRQAIDSLLKTSSTADVEEKKQRALAAAGTFRSGVSRLSTRHDEHLAEAYKK